MHCWYASHKAIFGMDQKIRGLIFKIVRVTQLGTGLRDRIKGGPGVVKRGYILSTLHS